MNSESSRFSCSFLKLLFVLKSVCGPWYLLYAVFVGHKKGFVGLIGRLDLHLLMFSCLSKNDNSWSEHPRVHAQFCWIFSSVWNQKLHQRQFYGLLLFQSVSVSKRQKKILQSIHFISDDLKFYFSHDKFN